MNHLLKIVLLVLLTCGKCFPQNYANAWINFDGTQEYYKIYIWQEGVYRIDFNTLSNSGINVSNIDPNKFQLWHRGQEQYIYIEGENDNSFDPGDFIEFHGQQNDGWLDSSLFKNVSDQAHTKYSLFTDTAVYFLTWHITNTNNKRMSLKTAIDFINYSPASFFIHHIFQHYPNVHYRGFPHYVSSSAPPAYESEYTDGQGWFMGFIEAQTINEPLNDLNTAYVYAGGTNAEVEIVVNGMSNSNHSFTVQFASINSTLSYSGYGLKKANYTISPSSVTSNNFSFTAGASPDKNSLSYISLKYPRTFDLDNATSFSMVIPAKTTKTLLNISNFNASSTTVRLYDLVRHTRITVVQNGSIHQALVPSSSTEITCYLTSDNQVKNITQLTKVNFVDYKNEDSDYLIITHNSLLSSVNDYADYRTNDPNGGNYNVLVIDIDQLYDQFAYGVKKHPLSIRNFIDFALDTLNNGWTQKPDYLFIIGKGYHFGNLGTDPSPIYARTDPNYFASVLVPTFGDPPSDNLLTAGLDGSGQEPAIPTGRLAAKTTLDVDNYLAKVMAFELALLSPQEWMKNVIHLAGGAISGQHEQLKSFLATYEDTIEAPYFGGNVRNFYKSSTNPLEIITTDEFYDLVDNGIAIMTFFGHSTSALGFDINIDEPEAYNNVDKYYYLLALGCYTGNIHLTGELSHSEKFVLADEKGSIGYLASSSLGVNTYLHYFTREFYSQFGVKNYGKGIGYCIQQTIKENEQQNTSVFTNITSKQMTYHGDPALVIYAHSKPDYVVSDTSIIVNPEILTSDLDSFDVNIVVINIGKAIDTTLRVELVRKFPDGTESSIEQFNTATYYKDTVSFKLAMNSSAGAGINSLSALVDLPVDLIDELENFTNNFTSIDVFVISGDIIPVYPYKYSIVDDLNIPFKASTGNPFQGFKKYYFEIDTSDNFSSSVKKDTSLYGTGGVLKWATTLPLNDDSLVYYWRTRLDTLYSDTARWFESTFIYIKDASTGWNQTHFPQFTKGNAFQFINPDKVARKFDYVPTFDNIMCQNQGTNGPGNLLELKYWFNNVLQDYGSCAGNALILAVFDKSTMTPWEKPFGSTKYGSQNCSSWRAEKKFVFRANNASQRDSIVELIQNTISDSTWVLMYTHEDNFIQDWEPGLIQAFESLGAAHLGDVQNDYPYILLGKKGFPIGQAIELYADTNSATPPDEQVLFLDTTVQNNWYHGFMTSELIGPAKSWGSIHWRYTLESSDSINLSIIGIDKFGKDTVLYSSVDSLDMFLTNIDANVYWYLKLRVMLKDSINQTAPKLNMLRVFYEAVPEAALNPSIYYTIYADTLQEGEQVNMSIAVENISIWDMDSLKIKYQVIDKNRNRTTLNYPRQAPLLAGDTLITNISFNTGGYPGLNYLWIDVNPDNDQPEQYHFNNVAQIPIYVIKDMTNPILDVTFDGVHILDGDIVSSKPHIAIRLTDENKFLELNDTSLFKIYLKEPDSSLKTIYFRNKLNEEILKFTPADLSKGNSAVIEYDPEFTNDGVYELRVEGKDVSDNQSGQFVYTVTFEVVSKSTITQIINYPNPFSTSTRFVFVLTGSELPTYLNIQILTISGKVVREIT
ncbi:hypothetical protein JYT51_01420, partial [Candidatus Amoebophilus asiaticus]|nr:hypothetical protein [Candidatus Amoebophilus asiaticus]